MLGIVDHRWPDPGTEDPDRGSGYISKEPTISLAKAAGFKLASGRVGHPRSVWALPPTLALGDEDRDKYVAIDASDRYLLKFEKPVK